MDGETVINDDLSSFCPISYPITAKQAAARYPLLHLPQIPSLLFSPLFQTDLLLSLPFSPFLFPSVDRLVTVVERGKRRGFDRSISSSRLSSVPSNVNRIDPCSSMEIQLCTRRRGEDTAEPWQPWPRLWGPNVHPCTRGISLDSRRSTSPAKMDTTKAAASSCWLVAIPTFKTTWVIGQLSFLPPSASPRFLSFSFVSCFPVSRNSPFKPFILTAVVNTIASFRVSNVVTLWDGWKIPQFSVRGHAATHVCEVRPRRCYEDLDLRPLPCVWSKQGEI